MSSCKNKTTSPVPCAMGEYSSEGEMLCSDCPKGFYCPRQEMSAPIACTNGTYSATAKSTQCQECPAGKKCPYSSQSPQECNNGTYSLAGSPQCTVCPRGHRYV